MGKSKRKKGIPANKKQGTPAHKTVGNVRDKTITPVSEPAADLQSLLVGILPDGKKNTVVTLIAVRPVHISSIEVNSLVLMADRDAVKDELVMAAGSSFDSRPISFYLHLTGLPNTLISVELLMDGMSEDKSDLYIPNSGNLVVQKNIP